MELLSTLLGWLFLSSVLSFQLCIIQNRVARKILGPKRDGVTRNWRRLRRKELHKLYIPPYIIRIVRSMRIKWAGGCSTHGKEERWLQGFGEKPSNNDNTMETYV